MTSPADCRPESEPCASPKPLPEIEPLIQSLAGEFELVLGSPDRVKTLCDRLAEELQSACDVTKFGCLLQLLPLLRRQSGARASPVFAILESAVSSAQDPWPLLKGMLAARDRNLVLRALDLTVSRTAAGFLQVNREIALFFAEQVEIEDSPLALLPSLRKIAVILSCLPLSHTSVICPLTDLFLNETDGMLRRLAARVLDLDGQLPSGTLAVKLMGRDPYEFLRPYLDYTRATYLDLLHLVPRPGSPPALASLRKAEEACGEVLLREIIAELGWARVNLGLEIREYVGLSFDGSFPLVVLPYEAPVLERCGEARKVFEHYLFIAHGGEPEEDRKDSAGEGVVSRFRAFNLAQAEALADILDLAPLTGEKVRRILSRMDRIVEDFAVLFASHSDEVGILPGVYQDLRQKIVWELEKESLSSLLSTELTRLVQTFENPPSLGGVRTLHGLKRYLHQKGLRLGMRLVQTGRSTNRTLDLVVASRKRILRTFKGISYVDFEPEGEAEGMPAAVPYPVSALADALGRQLLHGQETFPAVKIFCYGNEVHYYLSYRNHPALLRIDYSPPLQGGMIDLEYYGVSKYELSLHPNPSLEAIRLFFRRLEFDVQVENTHIHARYDKERAIDLEDLCRKAEAVFGLIPYLMELDWMIGGLSLGSEARHMVAENWAERFVLWGALPISQLLTKDRQAILAGVEQGPTGEQEMPWPGEGPYQDRYTSPLPEDFLVRLRSTVEDLGLDLGALVEEKDCRVLGQVRIERCFLDPIREAVAYRELLPSPAGLRRCSALLFQREHEAERLADILAASDEILVSAGDLARLIAPLERFLRFQTTGYLDGYEVQRTRLSLRGERLGLYVLRDEAGIIRLALFARGEGLWRKRDEPDGPWTSNSSCDAMTLACLLRRVNWPVENTTASVQSAAEIAREIRQRFRRGIEVRLPAPQPGERVVTGLKASPGRAVGVALCGTAGRSPKDFDGAVLIAPAVRPEDNTFLYHSAGIVSTGGGVLSHAGLIAAQFHKPAMIIPGQWRQLPEGSSALLYRTLDFCEELSTRHGRRITSRRKIREQEHELREGDLVVLDASGGTLRVLGQDRVTMALHENFQLLGDTGRRLSHASDPHEILHLRGWRLRATHQIEKVLSKLTDTVLARHAVHEILFSRVHGEIGSSHGARAHLLSLILGNRAIGGSIRDHLLHIASGMERTYRRLCDKVMERVPVSTSLYEILALRLEVLRFRQSLLDASAALRACGVSESETGLPETGTMESAVRSRALALRAEKIQALQEPTASASAAFRSLQLRRQIERIDAVLGTAADSRPCGRNPLPSPPPAPSQAGCRFVLEPVACGFESFELIGWKAANLAEAERIGGSGLIPSWFVITNEAFEEMLGEPLDHNALGREGVPSGAANLREAIDAIAERRGIDNVQKSVQIRGIWERVSFKQEVADEILAAYRRLVQIPQSGSDGDDRKPFVAIRSSAREEDAELAARAGEFETFLFIQGEKALLDHVKRAWSGLWTERALHNRAVLGTGRERTGGGIIVQRIVWSRVSGVLQTVNVAEGEMREMVINAGLGLGEGVVSGVVGADQIVVDKESHMESEPLRFRYVTADKRERVVFNRRLDLGTIREETLYHQRLRPALEYVELMELVRTAASLEVVYGFPLDIEFGIEGTKLWILQVRPVATFASVLSETFERYPLN